MKPSDYIGILLVVGVVGVGAYAVHTNARRGAPAPAAPVAAQAQAPAAPRPAPTSAGNKIVNTLTPLVTLGGAVIDTFGKFRNLFP